MGNTFDISLAPFSETEHPTGARLSFRGARDGETEIFAKVHRPGPKGGTWSEQSLGRVHTHDLERVLAVVSALTGGHAR